MAFELLTETPGLLRVGHVLRFDGSGWDEKYADKWFRVAQAQQIKYDISRVISANTSRDLDFASPAGGGVSDTALSLMPDKEDTLYEQLWGIRGTPLVYPMYENRYFLQLEITRVAPDTGDERLRYLGFYDQNDSSLAMPRVREYVVKVNNGTPVLRLYNDFDLDELMILRVVVNRVRLEKKAEADIPENIRPMARIIRHHRSFSW